MTGQFFRSGSKVYTNFDETSKGASELINNFYTEGWQAFVKSAGAPGYNITGVGSFARVSNILAMANFGNDILEEWKKKQGRGKAWLKTE